MAGKRADSDGVKAKIMESAILGVKVPDHMELRDIDKPFWKAITRARAVWTDIDLCHAVNLARHMGDIQLCRRDIEELRKSEAQTKEEKAQRADAVKVERRYLEELMKTSISLSRMIQVHAAATIGESKLARGKNVAKREAIEAIESTQEDDLIARPLN